MKHPAFLLLVLPTLAQAQTATVSVSGMWKVHSNVAGNESDSTCTFVQTGTDLSGSCKSEQGDSKLTGKVEGNKVSWTYNADYNGTALTVKYTGTLAGQKITGEESVDPFGVSGEFTATAAK